VFDFATEKLEHFNPPPPKGGHGGGDGGLSEAFITAVAKHDQKELGVTASEILASHLLVFAAEESRVQERTVDFQKYVADILGQYRKVPD